MNHTTPDWLELARRHVWQPYTQMRGAPPPVPIVRAEGVYFHTADGRRILDGISSWWVNIHGHNHPRLNEALRRQAERMAHVMFARFTHEPGARLAGALVERAPGKLPHVFYSDDGSTAVEAALKMAYQYWRYRGDTRRHSFVAIEKAYHGDTLGAMAAGDVKEFHSEFSELFFRVHHARGPRTGPSSRSSLEAILEREGSTVAAVIIEPMVQGAGGMIVWPAEFLRHVRAVTRAHGIPLIADEVFTGFGRTGKMFACEHGPVEPDLLCLSKAITGGYMPLAATLATDEIYDAFLSDDRGRAFLHGHSYTGNALACALGLESLAILDDDDCLARVRRLEHLFAERLERIARLPAVRETRGIGGIAVMELTTAGRAGYLDDLGPRLSAALLERGIFLRPLGNVLYFVPPYVITDAEAHLVFDAIEAALAELS
jgi:adenosylmethionine-8-amino-7-oxononanoate aminotransferase